MSTRIIIKSLFEILLQISDFIAKNNTTYKNITTN